MMRLSTLWKVDRTLLDPPRLFAWGAALGRLHARVVAYAGPAPAMRPL